VRVLVREAAETWLDQHLGADSSIATYRSVLRAHIDPAIGGKPIGAIRREDIKTLIAGMHRKGLSASRIGCAHLVISAVLAEAVRDKRLAESPCTGIQLPGVVTAADFILPAHPQVEAVAAGLPPDWAATVWLMHGCGLRIGEALAVNLRCRTNRGKTLRVKEQVNPAARLRPLKFRRGGVPRHSAASVRQRGDRQARRRARHYARWIPVPGPQVQARRPAQLPGRLPACRS
jgi:integrase